MTAMFHKIILLTAWMMMMLCLTAQGAGSHRAQFVCPPAEDILPCKCRVRPFPAVKCFEVHSLKIVRNALDHKFHGSPISLQISNGNIWQLPEFALGNIPIKKLTIRDGNVRNIDDEAFNGLEKLLYLELANDRLFEVPRTALSKLTSLSTLSLAENFLVRLEKDSFEDLENLKVLVLRHNRLSYIQRGALPSGLRTLSINSNHLTCLNNSLVGLFDLEWLFLGDNRLTDIRGELDNLHNLVILSMENNLISDLGASLQNLQKLKSLNLAFNMLQTLHQALKSLENLEYLNLSHNYLSELDDDIFTSTPHLRYLDLSGNQFFSLSPSLSSLNELIHLNLSNNELASFKYVDKNDRSNLLDIDLSHNQIESTRSIETRHLSKLRVLNLRGNKLFSLHHGLKTLRDLSILDIGENRLSLLQENQFAHNKRLEKLDITENQWLCNEEFTNSLRNLETRMVQIKGKPSCYQYQDNVL